MDESEYKELLEYLIEQLEKNEAFDVVKQIKQVAVSKITEDEESHEEFEKPQKKLYPLFIEDDKEEIRTNSKSKTPNFNNDLLKSDYKHIGKTVLRNLTNQEIFLEAIKILTNYLRTTPKMANRISVLFKTKPENIRWEFDINETLDEKQVYSLSSMLEITDEETNIDELLSILKNEVINEGESLNGNQRSP